MTELKKKSAIILLLGLLGFVSGCVTTSREDLMMKGISKDPLKIEEYISKYEKKHPIGKPVPMDLSKAEIKPDEEQVERTEYWEKFSSDAEEIRLLLATYIVVRENVWSDAYSHVSGGDQVGWAIFKNGIKLKWILRPGGLAKLVYKDGGTIYMAACRSNNPSFDLCK